MNKIIKYKEFYAIDFINDNIGYTVKTFKSKRQAKRYYKLYKSK